MPSSDSSQSPPWAVADSHEQQYVLITGANSGVGLGIGQRVMDEFLASRSLSSHLILIPTTRSVSKSRDTILSLRDHLHHVARTSSQLRSRAGGSSYDPQTVIDRVHILSAQLDLCNLRSVYDVADQLCKGQLEDPTGYIKHPVSIPRVDAAIFNAGIGGWLGFNWFGLAKQIFTVGLKQATTYPNFKMHYPAITLDTDKLLAKAPPATDGTKPPPALAEVFCANLFGHYVLAHELVPLMTRQPVDDTPAGRVIWTSSIDAEGGHLNSGDFQAAKVSPPYESSKRITDVISLTAGLPSVAPVAESFFSPAAVKDDDDDEKVKRPRFYLCHPGIVCTPLMPLNWFLFFWYTVVMYLSRFLGSPWHVVDSYRGACAASWLALATQDDLDCRQAERSKWGSSATPMGLTQPKRTEVEGWGWDGLLPGEKQSATGNTPAEKEEGILSRDCGRKWDASPLTQEKRLQFEEHGRWCWSELEALRVAWEKALGRSGQ